MQVSEADRPQNSETTLMQELFKYADAGAALIQIRTREPLRTALALRRSFCTKADETPYHEWDMLNGFRKFTHENYHLHKTPGADKPEQFPMAFRQPLDLIRNPQSELYARPDIVHYFAFVNPQLHIANNPLVHEMIQQYSALLSSSNVCILLITDNAPIENVPMGQVLVAELKTPTAAELEKSVRAITKDMFSNGANPFESDKDLPDDEYKRLALVGLGLTAFEFETYASVAIIDAGMRKDKRLTYDMLAEGVMRGKTQIVRQSELLELSQPGDINEVGGMGALKDWLGKRTNCYSDEAKEYGIEAPKGIALVGVPGTGKSLVARAVASVMGIPLVRLDFSRVFAKYVGDSEKRVRAALDMVESMAPCVLFVDEIDKGLGGAGGGSDGGASSRVLGTFLSWLQDNKAPVFTMVTANRVNGLPPELMRKGRFDEIFSVGMPNADERREVLAIHLEKRGRSIESFDTVQIATYLRDTHNFVPAEIEATVKTALIEAYSAGKEDLEMDDLLAAVEGTIPMAKSNKERIDEMIAWAEHNAVSVSAPVEDKPMESRTRLRTTRRK